MSPNLTAQAPNIHNHVIKVTALVTAVACGTYILWHSFIKDRPPFGSQAGSGRQNRRHRRMYTNDGQLIYPQTSSLAVERVKSSEENSFKQPDKHLIQSVAGSLSIENINFSKACKKSTSRDLSPGCKQPITSTVSSRYHRIMPAKQNESPPSGYVTVFTSNGRKLWQRIHINQCPIYEERTEPERMIFRLPFLQQTDDIGNPETLRQRMEFFILPMLNTNRRISDESLAVHTGADNLLDVDMDGDVEEPEPLGLMGPEVSFVEETVGPENVVQRPVFIRRTQMDLIDMGPVPHRERVGRHDNRLHRPATTI